jgi:hypothetical protein
LLALTLHQAKVMKILTWLYSNSLQLAVALITSSFLLSCNPTKKLREGELLLDKNIVSIKSNTTIVSIKLNTIDKSETAEYIKQKPNRKMLFWKFYLHLYNTVNEQKIEKRKIKRYARVESVNARRLKKNNIINAMREKKGKTHRDLILKKKEIWRLNEWILSIGELPVIYDSLLAKKSAKQINLFLKNNGFFNSKVKDSLLFNNKKAIVHYIVYPGKPYVFRNIKYEIKDKNIKYFTFSDTASSLIKRGVNYNIETLQKERDRITTMLRNRGYYKFSKEYIYFEVDSSLGTHEVGITLGIKNPLLDINGVKDSTIEGAHTQFYINNIFIHTEYDQKTKQQPHDTLIIDNYSLISSGPLRYKTRLITDAVFFSKGEIFQQSHADQTYKRLSDLKLFRATQVQFIQINDSQIDSYIYLSTIPKQSISTETELINTSGTQGIAGSLVYQNKNTFKGGEIFEVKLKGALEVQKTKNKEQSQIITGIESPIPFNTLELGSEINFFIPRFVTPFNISGIKNNNAKTNISGTYNFQRRPDFGRSIANTSFGYSWNEVETKHHTINPIEFNLVNIFDLSQSFQTTINNSKKDLFLQNSYSDHFTLGSRYAFVFSNQDLRKNKNFTYFRFGAEAAGNLLRGSFNLIDRYVSKLDYIPKPEGISYTIENIPFSQFLRADIDCRYYQITSEKSKLVYRINVGVGKPLYNLRSLPLEKSFFSGGPNGLRAWQARTLGPGGFVDSTNSNFADKIGDTKIEGNIEYRFHIIKIINSALFIDAGNIWLRNYQTSYPEGNFDFNGAKFIGQIALGAGMGLRLDFNFFIIRLDWAIKLKDPSLPINDRWTFGKKPLNHGVLNFGIGYPF